MPEQKRNENRQGRHTTPQPPTSKSGHIKTKRQYRTPETDAMADIILAHDLQIPPRTSSLPILARAFKKILWECQDAKKVLGLVRTKGSTSFSFPPRLDVGAFLEQKRRQKITPSRAHESALLKFYPERTDIRQVTRDDANAKSIVEGLTDEHLEAIVSSSGTPLL